MIDTLTIERAKQVDLVHLAEQHSQLKKEGAGEWAGPCPKCGGSDRLHVRAEWFFCRQCHEKRGDAIEFLRWMQPGLSFADAVAQLAGDAAMPQPVKRKRVVAPRKQPAQWRQKSENLLREMQELLFSAEGEAGQQYLEGRGLDPHTWLLFGLGYRPDAALPGTDGKMRAPAIAMPWFAGGRLVGIRYRFLMSHHYIDDGERERTEKQTAEYESDFAGRLFGGQMLAGAGEGKRWLLITEGELNAMSAWQVAHETHLDVLSLGSESAHLSDKAISYAQQYRRVVVWADKGDIAGKLAEKIPGAYAVRSPLRKDAAGEVMLGADGKPLKIDANDLLRSGLLGGFLALARADAATTTEELEALLWALYEGALTLRGLDTATAKAIESLAAKLGKQVDLEQPEPGRWVAR